MLVADMTERAVVVCVCVQGQGQVEQTQTSSSLTSGRLVAFAQPANPFRGLVVLVVDQPLVVHLSALEPTTTTTISCASFRSPTTTTTISCASFHPPTPMTTIGCACFHFLTTMTTCTIAGRDN